MRKTDARAPPLARGIHVLLEMRSDGGRSIVPHDGDGPNGLEIDESDLIGISARDRWAAAG
jgi:hypothetical protein